MPELQGAVSDGVMMKFTLLILIVLWASCAPKVEPTFITQPTLQKPKVIIPQRSEPVSLEKAVNWGAKQGGLETLREVFLANGDFEVRFWKSQQPTGLSGFVFRKRGEKYSAYNVDKILFDEKQKLGKAYINPQSDWETVVRKLNEAEIFTLSDSSELKNYKGNNITDGFSYIVEINKDEVYRIYEYRNPDRAENPEAKQIVKIGNIIAEEFGLEEFRADTK
jgi:hypothetical protein